MILRITALGALLSALTEVSAQVAPEITTLAEGFNYIAKLPCAACPFLYQDTSEGRNGPWIDRIDDNALVSRRGRFIVVRAKGNDSSRLGHQSKPCDYSWSTTWARVSSSY